jgi:flagellar protein FlaG
MFPTNAPKIQIANSEDYEERYSNSVQVRVNLWDFFLMFGTISQNSPDVVTITNFEGIYLSPQQAKALANLLNQNIAQYEGTFGEIRLEPAAGGGPVQ